jgi:BirA family biotin operon repressor/biotin-[acetyl-CoA-carboxylase] ligase
VSLPGGSVVTGTASGVDDAGRLVVRSAGQSVPVSAGDVLHVR